MPRFFLKEAPQDGCKELTLTGDDAHHIAYSLRMKVGDDLVASDFFGNEYKCKISAFTKDSVTLNVLDVSRCESEPRLKVRIFQALPKGDKLETVVQKATEIGASAFFPVLTSRCISRPDEKGGAKKVERLSRIAEEAAKQSGRGIIPTVSPVCSFDAALEEMKKDTLSLMCYECEDKRSLRAVLAGNAGKLTENESASVSVFIGPEGGISEAEAEKAREAGIVTVGLGKRILRTETAPIFAVSAILFFSGDME